MAGSLFPAAPTIVNLGLPGFIIESLARMLDWNRKTRAELDRTGAWGAGARGGTRVSERIYDKSP